MYVADKLFFHGHKIYYNHDQQSTYSNLLTLHEGNDAGYEEFEYSQYVNKFKYDIEFHDYHPMINLDSIQIDIISISCDSKWETTIYFKHKPDIMTIWNKVNDNEWLISSTNKTKWKENCKNMKRNKVSMLYMMDECKLYSNQQDEEYYIQCDNTRKATYYDLFEHLDLDLQTKDINIHHNDEFNHNIQHETKSDDNRKRRRLSTLGTLYEFLKSNWNPSELANSLSSNFGFNSSGNNTDSSITGGVIEVTKPLFHFGVEYKQDIIENLISLTGQFSLKSALSIRIKIENNKLLSYFAGIKPTSAISIALAFEYTKEITKDQSLGKLSKTFGLNAGIFKVGIDVGLEIIAGIKTVVKGSFSCSYTFTLKGEMGLTFKDSQDYIPTQTHNISNSITCDELTASLNIQTYLYPALYIAIDIFFFDVELLRLSFKPYLEFNAAFSTQSDDCHFDIQFNRGLQLVLSSEIANKEWSLYSNKWPIWTGCLDNIFPSLLSTYNNPDSTTKLKLPNGGLQSGDCINRHLPKSVSTLTANQITGAVGTSWHGGFWNGFTSSQVLGFEAFTERYHTFQVVDTQSTTSSQFITSTILNHVNASCLLLLNMTFERNTDDGNDYLFDVIYNNQPSLNNCLLATADPEAFKSYKYWFDNFFFSSPSAFYFGELDSFIFYSTSAIQLLRTEPFAELNDLPTQFFRYGQVWNGSMKSLQYGVSTFPVDRSVTIDMNENSDTHGTLKIDDISYSFTIKTDYARNSTTALYFDCDGETQTWMLGTLAITENGDAFYYGASTSWSTNDINCKTVQGVFVLKLSDGAIPINITNGSSAVCDGIYIDPKDSDISSDDNNEVTIGGIVGGVLVLICGIGVCLYCRKECCRCCKKKCCRCCKKKCCKNFSFDEEETKNEMTSQTV